MAYLQELQLDTKGFSKFWAAAGAANAMTRATAIMSFFIGVILSECVS
jgi:preprotein translocase subunit SecG